jgi:hypothetical protein
MIADQIIFFYKHLPKYSFLYENTVIISNIKNNFEENFSHFPLSNCARISALKRIKIVELFRMIGTLMNTFLL